MAPPGHTTLSELCSLLPGTPTHQLPRPRFQARNSAAKSQDVLVEFECVLRIEFTAIVQPSPTNGVAAEAACWTLLPHSHQGFQAFFVVVLLRQMACVLNGADLPQREASRQFSLMCSRPSHVKVSHSPKSNTAVHANVRRAARERFQLEVQACRTSRGRAMTCCVEQL